MFTEQRREKILLMLNHQESIRIQDLIGELKASPATLRRDLEALESEGQLKRTNGGALLPKKAANPSSLEEPLFHLKSASHLPEKERIAKSAAELIKEGDTLCIDSG